jgi:hypothetical protein
LHFFSYTEEKEIFGSGAQFLMILPIIIAGNTNSIAKKKKLKMV